MVWLNYLIGHGYFWFDLFFVLSGYVMAMTYADMFAAIASWAAYRDFQCKQVARVYPLYFAITMVLSLYSLLIYGGYSDVYRPAIELKQLVLHM